MNDWLWEWAAVTPARLALATDGCDLTYAELHTATSALAGRLAASGVVAGDRVALLMPTGLDYVCAIHALARLQAVLVPLNTRLTAAELARQLQRTQARLLLHSTEHSAIAAELAHVVPLVRAPASLPAAPPLDVPPQPLQLDATQAIIFTSGTTGEPKGAMLSFSNHFWSATASAFRLGVQPDDCWLSCLPLYHVGGLAVILRAALYGTAAVLQPRFEVAAFHRAIDSGRITLTSLVPTMLHRLLASRVEPWPASLRCVLVGGAAASPSLLAEAERQGLPIATTYGMTEACSQVATAPPPTAAAKPGTVGRPLLFTSVRILDQAGSEVAAGTVGEIAVRGPAVMQGYWNDPIASARALPDGELRTGDVGFVDADGDLWVVQRRSDIILSGGENIYPAEVEAALDGHPAVARTCVVGVDDPEWGQCVAALVEPVAGMTVDEAALRQHLRGRLASYKQPSVYCFTTELPQTASGKIERRAVRSQILAQLATREES